MLEEAGAPVSGGAAIKTEGDDGAWLVQPVKIDAAQMPAISSAANEESLPHRRLTAAEYLCSFLC